MNIISHGFDPVGKPLRIGNEVTFFIPSYGPAVVNNNVLITGGLQAAFNHSISCFHDQLFADVHAESIPAVPTHRRGFCQSFKRLPMKA